MNESRRVAQDVSNLCYVIVILVHLSAFAVTLLNLLQMENNCSQGVGMTLDLSLSVQHSHACAFPTLEAFCDHFPVFILLLLS